MKNTANIITYVKKPGGGYYVFFGQSEIGSVSKTTLRTDRHNASAGYSKGWELKGADGNKEIGCTRKDAVETYVGNWK